MRLSDIKNLPVYTKSGRYLGKILDIEIDPISQLVLRYQVGGRCPWITSLWKGRLFINREQVVSLTSNAMIVEDLIITEKTLSETRLVVE